MLRKHQLKSTGELAAKAILSDVSAIAEGTFVPCGDGKLQVRLTLSAKSDVPAAEAGEPSIVYIKSIKISAVDGDPSGGTYEVRGCKTENGESCETVMLDAEGKAVLTGLITVPQVYGAGEIAYSAEIEYAKAAGAASEAPLTVSGKITSGDISLCPTNDLSIVASKGFYEQCGGKMKFTADLQIPESGMQFMVPAELMIHQKDQPNFTVYQDYECRYTRFDEEGNPIGGDACAAGQRIDLSPNGKIRLEVYLNVMSNPISETSGEESLDLKWRIGGSNYFLMGSLESQPGPESLCAARIVPLAPMAPAEGLEDNPLPKNPLWFVTHDKTVVGVYQKCGKFAVMQIRLRNEGAKPGIITLPGAVSVNGGTPISYYWLSTVQPNGNQIELKPGETVSLLGRLYLTNVVSQTNADTPIYGTVSFPEWGFVLGGNLVSDKASSRCGGV